jgi:hypothetical protein
MCTVAGALWQGLLGRPASESGRLCRGLGPRPGQPLPEGASVGYASRTCVRPRPVDADHERILTDGKSFVLRSLQVLLGDLVTSVARLKMRTVDDTGTEIGAREALFTRIIPPGGVGAELGVFKGTLSSFVLAVNRPAKLH